MLEHFDGRILIRDQHLRVLQEEHSHSPLVALRVAYPRFALRQAEVERLDSRLCRMMAQLKLRDEDHRGTVAMLKVCASRP